MRFWHDPDLYDLGRLTPAERAQCDWLYLDRFAGFQTVAFTWTMKQGIGAEPTDGADLVVKLRPQDALRAGDHCLKKLGRSLVRKKKLDRRRYIVWAERGKLGRLHLHGLVAVPHQMVTVECARLLDAAWMADEWSMWDSDYKVPLTEDDVKGWIGYQFKCGYDPALLSL